MSHHVVATLDELLHVFRLGRSGIARFYSDCRFASSTGRAVEVARCTRIFGAIGYDDDVIEPEGQHHSARGRVEPFVSRFRPVGVRTQALVEVAAVQIDQVVAFLDNFFCDQPGGPFGLCTVCIARIKTIHALPICGIHMRYFLFEGTEIHQRNDDQFS